MAMFPENVDDVAKSTIKVGSLTNIPLFTSRNLVKNEIIFDASNCGYYLFLWERIWMV